MGDDRLMANGAEFRPWYRTATGWFSVVSLIVALGAAAFTALQWQDAHNQLLLSMKPAVEFDTEDDADAPPVGVEITNAGPGPAVIKSVTYFVDRKSVKDWPEAADYAKLDAAQIQIFRFEPDDTLAVNENEWLVKHSKYHGKEDKKEIEVYRFHR
jgi:hypothetical protein